MYDESPTARALLALELIQGAPGVTAERLAARLGVSERAARRYVATLRDAGVPVESSRGPYGGYRVGRGVRTPPLLFTTAEALGLVMAVLDGHHDPDDTGDPVGSALGKITRVLPESVARTVEAVRRVRPAPDRAAARPETAVTTALVQACIDRSRLRLVYRLVGSAPAASAGAASAEEYREREMVVDPWAVVVRHARWYLLCWSRTADAVRVLRVDRVAVVEPMRGSFEPPADLDPVAAVEEHLAVGWRYEVEVLIDAPVEVVARCLPRQLGRLEPTDDDCSRLVGSTESVHWYAEQLAALPAPFRILGPPELRRAAAQIGRRLLDASTDLEETR